MMPTTTPNFVIRLHLLNNGKCKAETVNSNQVLSYLKMLRTAARTEKNGAHGVLVQRSAAAIC